MIHSVDITEETALASASGQTIRVPAYRAECSCGWLEKAHRLEDINFATEKHLREAT